MSWKDGCSICLGATLLFVSSWMLDIADAVEERESCLFWRNGIWLKTSNAIDI